MIHLRVIESMCDQVIFVEISAPSSCATFYPLLSAVLYFLWFVKSSRDRHARLIRQPSFRKIRRESLECEWRGMSRCATSLWHATAPHSSAERDCAVCQRRPHSFPGNTGWHKFAGKTSSLRSTPFVQRVFFFFFSCSEDRLELKAFL